MYNGENRLSELVRIAYKKLKASVYYDKTLLPLRDKIIDSEDDKIENKLSSLAKLRPENSRIWMALELRSPTSYLDGLDEIQYCNLINQELSP